MDISDPLIGFLMLMVATITAAYRTVIAWAMPNRHRQHLEWWAKLYRGWSPGGERWWRSNLNFWIMRIVYTLGLMLCLYAFYAIS